MKKKFIEIQREITLDHSGRGGARPGSGRKKMNSDVKKKVKSFTLSAETLKALGELQEALGLSSQTAVIEFITLKSHRDIVQPR